MFWRKNVDEETFLSKPTCVNSSHWILPSLTKACPSPLFHLLCSQFRITKAHKSPKKSIQQTSRHVHPYHPQRDWSVDSIFLRHIILSAFYQVWGVFQRTSNSNCCGNVADNTKRSKETMRIHKFAVIGLSIPRMLDRCWLRAFGWFQFLCECWPLVFMISMLMTTRLFTVLPTWPRSWISIFHFCNWCYVTARIHSLCRLLGSNVNVCRSYLWYRIEFNWRRLHVKSFSMQCSRGSDHICYTVLNSKEFP